MPVSLRFRASVCSREFCSPTVLVITGLLIVAASQLHHACWCCALGHCWSTQDLARLALLLLVQLTLRPCVFLCIHG